MKVGIVQWNEKSRICSGCFLAKSFRERLRGLLGRDSLFTDEAMLIKHCGSIHTIGMRFPIDLFFVDRSFHVVRIVRNVPSGKMMVFGGFHAAQVYETAVGAWPETISRGDELAFSEKA